MYRQILDPVAHSLAWSSLAAVLPLATLFLMLTIKTPVVPRVCQDGQKQADKPQTARTLEAVELAFWRHYGTVENAVDDLAAIYTPAVGGSIPSAPTSVFAGQHHTAICQSSSHTRSVLEGCSRSA